MQNIIKRDNILFGFLVIFAKKIIFKLSSSTWKNDVLTQNLSHRDKLITYVAEICQRLKKISWLFAFCAHHLELTIDIKIYILLDKKQFSKYDKTI